MCMPGMGGARQGYSAANPLPFGGQQPGRLGTPVGDPVNGVQKFSYQYGGTNGGSNHGTGQPQTAFYYMKTKPAAATPPKTVLKVGKAVTVKGTGQTPSNRPGYGHGTVKPGRLFPDRGAGDPTGAGEPATYGERYYKRRKNNSVAGDSLDPIARFGTDSNYAGATLLGSA